MAASAIAIDVGTSGVRPALLDASGAPLGFSSARLAHQADWIAARLGAAFGISDENNALKTGYDPVRRCWPSWLRDLGIRTALLPEIVEPGTPIGTIDPAVATRFGLPANVVIAAGTTDGCAAFLATGADTVGEAVT